MEQFTLNYGETPVTLNIPDAKWVKTIQGKEIEPLGDLKKEFDQAVTDCIDSPPLKEVIGPDDQITILIGDITRYWVRQDLIVSQLINYLTGLGVPYKNIVVIVAIGTHRMQTEDEFKKLITPKLYEKVKIINHDCDADDLVYVGTTSRGTRVEVNPLVVNRKVIIIGGTIHHLFSGYGGGRKSILPGVSSRSTVFQNHLLSMHPTEPHSNQETKPGLLENNSVNQDMLEACEFVSPAFVINIVVNTKGQQSRLICGHWKTSWEESCRYVHNYLGVQIPELADIAIASCGGFPNDMNLYQSTKTMFNAVQSIKPGGTILLLADCPEGGGADEFFGWIKNLRNGTLDPDLRANFTISGFIFYAAVETTANNRVVMLSKIPQETVKDMYIEAYPTVEEIMEHMDFRDKTVYVMPNGGMTFPYLEGKELK